MNALLLYLAGQHDDDDDDDVKMMLDLHYHY
jgi:hypothetical protein